MSLTVLIFEKLPDPGNSEMSNVDSGCCLSVLMCNLNSSLSNG